MPARQKLNAAYIRGSLVIASLVGAVCESWSVFFAALVVLLVGNVLTGEIRAARRKD